MASASGAAGSEKEKRSKDRVSFSYGVPVGIIAIDGTWRRDCTLLEIGEDDAKLSVAGPIAGLNLKEFFLVLSTSGAFRRCELVRVDGDGFDVRFLTKRNQRNSSLSKATD
jgi:hypothetical protein